MKLMDRLIAYALVACALAITLPGIVPSLTTLMAVGTVCFVTVRAVLYFTGRR